MRAEVLRIDGLSAERTLGCGLKQVHLNLYVGEVLGLIGLHNSGKSFLFDCLMGEAAAEAGRIFLNEEGMPAAAWTGSENIVRIQAQPALVPTQTVVENIFVIRRQRKRAFFVPWKKLRSQTAALMQKFGIELDPDQIVSELTLVERHIVEILKAFVSGGTLILMDDIMIPYTIGDYEVLYQVIRRFQKQGISFIICGCQMEKLQRLTDRCLFMVNGSTVKTVENIRRKQLDELKVLVAGAGRYTAPENVVRRQMPKSEKVIFEARRITVESGEVLNFTINEGEIVVMVDFFHQWVPQFIRRIADGRCDTGILLMRGRDIKRRDKRIYISDFLESNYMVDSLSLRDNLCLAVFRCISTLGFLNPVKMKVVERIFREQYRISEQEFTFNWGSLSFAEKMAVYLERIKLQKWEVMFCTNIENIMSLELEDMIRMQLKDMVRGRRAVCICASSFEKYAKLADSYLFVTEDKEVKKFTYEQLCEYFRI